MQKILLGSITALTLLGPPLMRAGDAHSSLKPAFQTSDRCVACHNGMKTKAGEDFSIGTEWRASIMANSSRDPYWQGSVRRETIDHPTASADIQDECSHCHMPMAFYESHLRDKKNGVFSHLPFDPDNKDSAAAMDGVSCSICHQISKKNLGTPESFVGNFIVDPPEAPNQHAEHGPYFIDSGHQRVMESSTGGFVPGEGMQIRDSALCATCHTLYTTALGKDGKPVGSLPEQVPYQEWQHSSYAGKTSCQSCHMPEVDGPTPVTSLFGILRPGVRRHSFVGANFFMQRILSTYRQDLSVTALPEELNVAAQHNVNFLQSYSARVSIRNIAASDGKLHADVFVENLTGHKLPTAYPSRRAWLHVVVRDRDGKTVFESGALNPDSSIQGNINDADPTRFESHFREITSSDQVEIYEPILKDSDGHVTTGLINAVGYLKDNRLLPSGFDKSSAEKGIQVVGDAAEDPDFTDKGSLVRYSVAVDPSAGPFHMEAELWYEPIGYRWAHNLGAYQAQETQRLVNYYDSLASGAAVILAKAEATK
ncbi:MAG: hypothetical protein DMG88_11875 [Acidobacteria bacterium]|nr:MAG: hypothetical protein DMG88_11875 [Acidobacteriota bacterium]